MVNDFLNIFPVITGAMKDIIEFLPPDVTETLKEMIRLRHILTN